MDQNLKLPLVSVLLPVFNSERYLREAIRSIIDQTYRNLELIIIDDGSTDRSLEIIRSFTDQRIFVFSNEKNLGLIASLNKGLQLCNGKYITRMDADDICFSQRIEKQLDFLEYNPQVVACGSDYITFSDRKYKRLTTISSPDAIKAWLMFATPLCHPSVMLRADIFQNPKLNYSSEFKHVEDYELWTRAVFEGDLANIPEPLLLYRDHPQQVSHQRRSEQISNSKKVQELYLKRLGFNFSAEQLDIHSLISSNQKITSVASLRSAIDWLQDLLQQNRHRQSINEDGMRYALARMHYDVCGNTSLGLKAFRIWKSSPLHEFYGNTTKSRLRLLAKCIIRRFR